MAKIKICGLRRTEDVEAVNKYLPDYVGFIFAENRKRTISVETAVMLKEKLSKNIPVVGVFVNQSIEYIAELLNKGIIDIAQLHGTEGEDEVVAVKKITGKPVIKAVSVKTEADIAAWADSAADYILLDNGIGGTGERFDWSLVKKMSKPFFLAGGINSDNIKEALLKNPDVIDVSGGVETDGFKDEAKIREIIEIIRKESK